MMVMICSSDNCATSGAFLCMFELCRYMKNENIEILVILPSNGTGTELLKKHNINYKIVKSYSWVMPINGGIIKRIKSFIKLVLNYRAINELVYIIRTYNIDIVHSNSTWTYVGIAAAKKCGVKCVWHLREAMELSQGLYVSYKKEYIEELIKYTNCFIAVSRFVEHYFREKKYVNKIYTIYDAVDSNRYYNSQKKLFKDKFVNIIMVNAVYPGKGQDELLDALTYLKKEVLGSIRVYIVGDVQCDLMYTKKLRKFILINGLQHQVKFLGVIRDIENVYLKGDISCICSPYEAFGRVTIESMLSGCVVLGCNSGATKEIIMNEQTGLLYQSGDCVDLAKKIEYILLHKENMIKMARNGQDYAIKHFSVDKNGESIYKIYKQI